MDINSIHYRVNYVCFIAQAVLKHNKKKNVQVIDGIGEVEINGVRYQAQIVLEPDEKDWVPEDKPTLRMCGWKD